MTDEYEPYKADLKEIPLDFKGFCNTFNFSKSYVYKLIREKGLPVKYIGTKTMLFYVSEVNYWIRNNDLSGD